MKKLLYIPLIASGGASEQYDLEAAFRRVFEVRVFDFLRSDNPNGDLIQHFDVFQPDIVHGQFQETNRISPSVLGNLKKHHPKVAFTQWCGDIREGPLPHVVDIGREIDLTLISHVGGLAEYSVRTGKPVAYWQNAVGERFFTDPSPEASGVVFCGNRYGHFPQSDERDRLVKAFQERFGREFKVYGNGWSGGINPIPWVDQPKVYRESRIVLGHNHVLQEWFFSDRQLIAMASGTPHLCQHSPNLEGCFEDKKTCMFYRTVQEALELATWLLEHPIVASSIGRAGQSFVREKHSWDVRVQEYIDLVRRILQVSL